MTNILRFSLPFALLLVALSIAAPTHITHAQDPTATDMPTATSTDVPTATWTPIPTPRDVPTVTETPTETATLTETPTGAPSLTETATLAEITPEVTETAVPSETVTETATPTASETATVTPTEEAAWEMMEIGTLHHNVQSRTPLDAGLSESSQFLTFVQRFDPDFPLEPDEAVAPVVAIAGEPTQHTCTGNGSQLQCASRPGDYVGPDPFVRLEVTVALGNDETVYQVVKFGTDYAYIPPPPMSEIVVILQDRDGLMLYGVKCSYSSSDLQGCSSNWSILPESPNQDGPVRGVKYVTMIHQTTEPVTQQYTLGLDNLWIQTIIDLPTPTGPADHPIVFASGEAGREEIWLASPGTQPTLQQLTTNQVSDINPAFSPDGTRIAFESNRDGNYNIYLMNADGSNQTPLTTNQEDDHFPAWSPDGTRIAFVRGNEIRAVYAVGSADEHSLHSHVGGAVSDLAWSPDGRWIIYVADNNLHLLSVFCRSECYKELTDDGATDGPYREPAWSPSGIRIVVNKADDLYFADVQYDISKYPKPPEQNESFLAPWVSLEVNTTGQDRHPSWSPDGGYLIFSSDHEGNPHLYQWNFVDETATKLIENAYNAQVSPYVACPNVNDYAYLTTAKGDMFTRKACLLEYRGIIFTATYHETSDNRMFGLNEIEAEITRLAETGQLSNYAAYSIMRDISAFSSFEVTIDHRYLFARAIVNGMLSDPYAPSQVNPMRYFASNFSCTVDRQDCDNENIIYHEGNDPNPGWLGGSFSSVQCPIHDENPSDNLADTPITVTKGGKERKVYPCLDRSFYNTLLYASLAGTNWLKGYRDIMPNLYMAVFDEVAGREDPLRGGSGSRTANREIELITGAKSVRVFVTSINRSVCETFEDAYMRQIQGPQGIPSPNETGPINWGFYPRPVTELTPIIDNFPPRVTNGLNGNPFQTRIGLSSDVIHVHYLAISLNSAGGVSDIVWVSQVFDSPIMDGLKYTTYPINRDPDYPGSGTFDHILPDTAYSTSPACN